MASVKPRVKAPKTASAGEVVTIKTLINHVMETGLRKDDDGNPIPRKIINTFVASLNGKEIVRVALEPAVSANPYFEFQAKVEESGEFLFQWTDDDGSVYESKSEVTVG